MKTAAKATAPKGKKKPDPARSDMPFAPAADSGTPAPVLSWFENTAIICPMCEKPTHIRSATKGGNVACHVRCFNCSPAVPADGPVKFATEEDIREIMASVDEVSPPKGDRPEDIVFDTPCGEEFGELVDYLRTFAMHASEWVRDKCGVECRHCGGDHPDLPAVVVHVRALIDLLDAQVVIGPHAEYVAECIRGGMTR